MMIKPAYLLELNSMCPACGNYFFESEVKSYNTFGAAVFSDGYTSASYAPYWLTRCPRCKQFFAKEHIFRLPKTVPFDFDSAVLKRLVEKEQDEKRRELFKQRLEEKREKEALYGRLSGHFTEEETKMDFIEKAIKQGQYYPITVHESNKAQFKLRLHKDLWHEYNMDRDKRSDEAYLKLCNDIIDILESKLFLDFADRLTLAELYRNIGEFEKCLLLLDGMKRNNSTEKFIDAISAEALKKNEKTAVVVEGRW